MKRSSDSAPKNRRPAPPEAAQSPVAARPTIMDVARAAGVSKATASKAMSLPPEECPVRKETRERILEIAGQMGYRPSWHAKALAHGRSHTVGLLYQGPFPWYVTGVYEGMLQSLAVSLQSRGYHLLFVPVTENDSSWSHMLHDQRLDGCVIVHQMPEYFQDVLCEAQLPAVLLNIKGEAQHLCIVPDDRGGAAQITQHLLDLGHRDIAFYQLPLRFQHWSIGERIAGYKDALRKTGLAAHAQLIECPADELAQQLSTHKVTGSAQKRLKQCPTALIAYSHGDAIELMHALWKHGIAVPQELSVATFNDVYPLEWMTPPLTTVQVPAHDMGWRAGDMLVNLIEERHRGQMPGEMKHPLITVAEKLIVRGSTAPPPK
jgi:LacI family transcriptional regulator